jgi:hypothetical protein
LGTTRRWDERAEWDEQEDLAEEGVACADVFSAMQLVVQRAVEPCDPHDGKDHRELAEPSRRQVVSQVVGRLRDKDDHHQVIEQFQGTD